MGCNCGLTTGTDWGLFLMHQVYQISSRSLLFAILACARHFYTSILCVDVGLIRMTTQCASIDIVGLGPPGFSSERVICAIPCAKGYHGCDPENRD